MVDGYYRYNSHAHAAGLKRLSARANVGPTSPGANRKVCFSFAAYARNVIDHLRRCQIHISKGLSDEEFHRIERTYGFSFPPDLRSILQEGLPIGVGFPNWRSASEKQLRMMLNLPIVGLCYEIARGRFWWNQWGSRPSDTEDALQIARKAFKKAPTLVPIYCHCYIPCFPNAAGNPVFFIYEKDTYYCGYDLADFFEREVFIPHNFHSSSDLSLLGFEDTRRKVNNGEGRRNGFGRNMSSINEEVAVEPQTRRSQLGMSEADAEILSQRLLSEFGRNMSSINEEVAVEEPQTRRSHLGMGEADAEILSQRLFSELSSSDQAPDSRWRWESYGRDSFSKNRESERNNEAVNAEVLSRKSLSEEPLQPLERPETLVRSAGNSPRMSRNIISRYTYFHEQPLPTKVLAQFTIAAPPWAAKTARRIEFWSDLVECKQSFNSLPPENLFSAFTVDVDLAKPSTKEEVGMKDEVMQGEGRSSKRWLSGYFEDMAKRLRRGGWKEDEIEEMVDAVLPAERSLPKQGAVDALVLNVDILSASLRKAGWSPQDVLEVLNFDLKNRRSALKITPNSKMNKVGNKLGEFLAQT